MPVYVCAFNVSSDTEEGREEGTPTGNKDAPSLLLSVDPARSADNTAERLSSCLPGHPLHVPSPPQVSPCLKVRLNSAEAAQIHSCIDVRTNASDEF